MKRLTPEDLKQRRSDPAEQSYIKVGMSSCGIAAGADEIFAFFQEELKRRNMDVRLARTGCAGMCYLEPLIEVRVADLPAIMYGKLTKDVALRILEEHVRDKRLVNDHVVDVPKRRLHE